MRHVKREPDPCERKAALAVAALLAGRGIVRPTLSLLSGSAARAVAAAVLTAFAVVSLVGAGAVLRSAGFIPLVALVGGVPVLLARAVGRVALPLLAPVV